MSSLPTPRGRRVLCRLSEIPSSVRELLCSGTTETASWTEWMATDMSSLARTIASQTSHCGLKSALLEAADSAYQNGILARLAILGSAVNSAVSSFEDAAFLEIRGHQCDVVRQWGVYRYVTSRRFILAVNGLQRGNSPPSVQDKDVRRQPFPLAPPSEQSRIASRIDELFSQIEHGARALERAQKLVERYRQSVLKAAVTGELTRDWRDRHNGELESGEALLARILHAHRASWEKAELKKLKGRGAKLANSRWQQKYKGPSPPREFDLPQVPDGWAWASVEQVGEVRLGRQRAPQHHTGDHMRPYLRVANVYEDRLELDDVKEMNFTPEEFKTYALRAGDILLNEGQSPELVGRPAMYRGEIPGCCYQKTLLRFRAYDGMSSDFALLVFRSYLHNGRFRRSANITTSIAHLAAERFVRIEFPVPCIEEQSKIVETATKLLSMLAHLEHEVIVQRRRIESLRQSVLIAAFAGRLTKQDANDEPATELVERIGADGGAALVAKPTRDQRKKTEQAA